MPQVDERLSLIKSMKLMPIMGKRFLYDPTTTFCAELDEQAWKVISRYQSTANGLASAEVAEALKKEFPSGAVDTVLGEWQSIAEAQRLGLPESIKYPRAQQRNGFLTAVMNPAHGCNLRCKYCFADHGTYGNKARFMTKKTARRAVDFYFENSRGRQVSISFFGGEPLLDKNLFFYISKYAIKRAKELDMKLKLHVTTNGTLIKGDVADFILENDFSLVISLDGPAQMHDECRPYANGKGSHATIMKNLERLKGTNVAKRTTLRATFAPARIALVERVLYFNELIEQGYAANCSVEPAGYPPDSPDGFDDASLKRLANEYEELAPIYLARAREGNPLKFFHFDAFLKRVVQSGKAYKECGAGVGTITFNPLGEIHACHHERDSLIGTLDTGIDPALQEQWRHNDLSNRRPCPTCWARYLCGGGCRHNAVQYYNDPAQPDPVTCAFKQAIIKTCLWLAVGMGKKDWERILRIRRPRGAANAPKTTTNRGGDDDDNSNT